MKLYVGLGNPVKLLSKTRHNVGYMVIDSLIEKLKKTNEIEEIEEIKGMYKCNAYSYFIKPYCGINDSGEYVKSAIEQLKILGVEIDNVLIVYDDMDLPLGETIVAKSPYMGEHKGVLSIDRIFNDCYMLPIGIGTPNETTSIYDFVLGEFTDKENKTIIPTISSVSDVLKVAMVNDLTFR